MLRREQIDFSITQNKLNLGMKKKENRNQAMSGHVTHLLSFLTSIGLRNMNSCLVDAPLSNLVSLF